MEYEKVIFLDIDGPLATDDCWRTPRSQVMFGKKKIYLWNSKCCEIFNEILNETGAEIVLSSDWRKYFTLDELDQIFKMNNIVKSPVAVTDEEKRFSDKQDIERINQIGRFLKNNTIKNWVAIDDMNLKDDIVPNFVQVEGEEGISAQGIKDQLISYLTQNN